METAKKSVLFIGPKFFRYEVSISNAIKENGYDVDFYDERTSNNSFMKAVFRVKKSLLKTFVERYYKKISENIKNKRYDYFFLIKGEVVPESFIINFKRINPGAKLIYYTYDSIKNNNKNSVYILKHFDSCYSFDFNDVEAYPLLKLKHLFYTEEYQQQKKSFKERRYNISFVGTLHSNRYIIIKSLFNNFQNTFIFFFSPAKWFFWFEKILKKNYKKMQISDVSFNKLTMYDVAKIFGESKSVLDIQRFGQTGLTMRTFEVLAAGAILVTTNTYIRQAEFYDPNFIVVVDDINNTKIIDEINEKINALTDSYLLANKKFDKYFVNNWVKEFFD